MSPPPPHLPPPPPRHDHGGCRQVVPVQHANALDGVPRIAAVFQNDCLYLAHHMVTLGHEFRQGLPPPANVTATMVDTVPLFRELAARRWVDMLGCRRGGAVFVIFVDTWYMCISRYTCVCVSSSMVRESHVEQQYLMYMIRYHSMDTLLVACDGIMFRSLA